MVNPVFLEQANRQAEVAQFASDLAHGCLIACGLLVGVYLHALWKQKRDKDIDKDDD